MKKKVFFIVSSLGAGGSERVFWLLSQGFDKHKFDVFIVHLGSDITAFPIDLDCVTVINLETRKASKSVKKLYKLIKKERPYAVFSTGAHINILVALVSLFVKIPYKMAREANVYKEMAKVNGGESFLLKVLISISYRVFNCVVCQSKEIKKSFEETFWFPTKKLKIIANPVQISSVPLRIKNNDKHKILIVGRLEPEKAHNKIIKIMASLPNDYHLTIAGDGNCRVEILKQIADLNLKNRIALLGSINNVSELMFAHDVCVLTSRTEGFPNVLLESLAVGTPVVAYKVGGLSDLIVPDFNGYMIMQDDEETFLKYLIQTCNRTWNRTEIIKDIEQRYSLEKISGLYQNLIA